MEQVEQAVRECCAGMTPDEIEDQVAVSSVAPMVQDLSGFARYLAALAQTGDG